MSKAPPPRGGIAGVALLLCLTTAAIGAAIEFTGPAGGFWIGDLPGAPAAIGAGAAVLVVIVARLALLAFGGRGGGDADGHA